MDLKILFFDIEILPRHFYTNFGADRSTICTFGYKWGHHKKAKALDLLDYPEDFEDNPFKEEKLVKDAHNIMKEADMCIHHYGDKFDFPYMNTKFMKYGLHPIKDIPLTDTWKGSKYKLKLSSNRLDNIAEYFGLARKDDIPVSTWFDIIRGHKPSMRLMTKYCIQDVEVLYQVYQEVMSFIMPTKINASIARNGTRLGCMRCGSTDVRRYGVQVLVSGKYQKWQCKDCGHLYKDTCRLLEE